MFKKLLSNLPFNPSLITQISFYAQHLKRETAVRRLGLVLIALAMLVQVIAIVSPSQSSVQATPDNDLINGGFSSQYQATADCVNNAQGYRDILAHFSISCDNVAGGQVVSLNACDYGQQLFSMGRIAYGKASETPVNVNGTNLFLRYLWDWPGGCNDSYQAVRVTSQNGVTAFLLFDCGNLTFIGLPQTPPPPKPVCANWYLGWGFWYQSPDGNVNNATATTTKDPCALYPPPVCAGWYAGWGFWYQSPDGNVNRATRTTTVDPCKKPAPPKPVCANWYLGWGFWYQSPDGDVNKATKTTTTNPCTSPPPVTPPQKCPENPAVLATDAKCKPCEKSQTREDKTACLEFSKKASNLTANIPDANNTTAKPGDVISYTLSTKNIGKVDITNWPINENISDILDYSDIVNLNGATKSANNDISWPAITIKPGQTVIKQFTVKVKNPIPSTPISSSDPGHFDLTMTNVYGNSVTIKLPGSITKTAEIATTSLPNTGPGEIIAIGFSITVFAGYFFARSRLMAKELAIIKADYSSGSI